jgi:hypothetical protein
LNNLYWRNTKENVKNEYELPPLIEDLVLLNFTPIESVLYTDSAELIDEPGMEQKQTKKQKQKNKKQQTKNKNIKQKNKK